LNKYFVKQLLDIIGLPVRQWPVYRCVTAISERRNAQL